jgi:hypothetical protein
MAGRTAPDSNRAQAARRRRKMLREVPVKANPTLGTRSARLRRPPVKHRASIVEHHILNHLTMAYSSTDRALMSWKALAHNGFRSPGPVRPSQSIDANDDTVMPLGAREFRRHKIGHEDSGTSVAAEPFHEDRPMTKKYARR